MYLLLFYFATNLFLCGKILYNLNTKLKDDKEAWEDAKLFLTITLLFGTIMWFKTALTKSS